MSKKNRQKTASIIKKRFKQNNKQHSTVPKALVELFKDDNPRFDEERFIFACQREVK